MLPKRVSMCRSALACFRRTKPEQPVALEALGSPSKEKVVKLQPWKQVCPCLGPLEALHLGMVLVAVGAVFRSLQGLSVAFLARRGYLFWTITCMHGVSGSLLCMLVAAAKSPDGVRSLFRASPGNRELLMLRAALGGVTVITAFYAVSYMDLGQATVIMATSPLFTAAMLSCFDEGTWSMSNSVAAVTCIFGMVLMTKCPPFFPRPSQPLSDMMPGLLASFASALSMAGINVCVRRMPQEDLLVITWWGMVGSLVLALPGCLQEQMASHRATGRLVWGQEGFWTDLLLLNMPGLVGCLAALCKTHAIQICHVVSILVLLYLEPVCALYWDWAVLKAPVDLTIVVGVLIIIAGCVISVLSDTSSHHPHHHHHHGSIDEEVTAVAPHHHHKPQCASPQGRKTDAAKRSSPANNPVHAA